MTQEERIVNELRAERNAVPAVRPGAAYPQPPRPRRLAMVAAAALIGGGALTLSIIGRGGAVASGPNEVALGPLLVPVTGEEVEVSGVTMAIAAPAPPLDPTLEIPGSEIPLDRSGSAGRAALPDDTDGPMVYIGTVADRAVVLHDDFPPVAGIGEEIASIVDRIRHGPMFCANVDGCSPATGEPLMGLGHSRSNQGPYVVTATGFDLPPETAAVVVTTGDGAIYWQRPAGNSVTLQWDQLHMPRRPYTFTALDSAGNSIFEQTFD